MSTTATRPPPVTIRAMLFGEETDATLGRAVHDDGVGFAGLRGARWLSGAAASAVTDEVGAALRRLLELDLADVVVAGWCKHRDLTEAGERTRRDPSSRELVALASHRVTWTQRPSIDLLVDDVPVETLEFELSVVADLTGVAAVVWRGHLVALEGGRCVVTVTLSLRGRSLRSQRREVDLRWVVPLRTSMRLGDPEAALPAPTVGSPTWPPPPPVGPPTSPPPAAVDPPTPPPGYAPPVVR